MVTTQSKKWPPKSSILRLKVSPQPFSRAPFRNQRSHRRRRRQRRWCPQPRRRWKRSWFGFCAAEKSIRMENDHTIFATRKVKGLFYPIWAFWTCFAPSSKPRHSFLKIPFTMQEMHHLEDWKRTLLVEESRKKIDEEKSPAHGRIRTHNHLIIRHVLYRCDTTAAKKSKFYTKKTLSLSQASGPSKWFLVSRKVGLKVSSTDFDEKKLVLTKQPFLAENIIS